MGKTLDLMHRHASCVPGAGGARTARLPAGAGPAVPDGPGALSNPAGRRTGKLGVTVVGEVHIFSGAGPGHQAVQLILRVHAGFPAGTVNPPEHVPAERNPRVRPPPREKLSGHPQGHVVRADGSGVGDGMVPQTVQAFPAARIGVLLGLTAVKWRSGGARPGRGVAVQRVLG